MIRLFDKGFISTDRTLFPVFDGGSYYFDNDKLVEEKNRDSYFFDKNMIVSRGLSRGHIGFRLFNKPELVVVKFY